LKVLGIKNLESNLIANYSEYVEKINSALDTELDLYSKSEFKEPLKYALGEGKRIRPIILLLSSECVGKINDSALALACAIEFLHTESIIHDDIIDNETVRRRKDPFYIKYGYNTSVLTGDFVLGLILNIASRINHQKITKNLATAAMLMSEGEIIETRLETSEDVTFNDYLKVIEYKTAIAFETACRLGAIIAGGTDKEIEYLASYGKNVGIAYQIRDDLHDWKNEDKLFNFIIKKSTDPRDVFNHMDELQKEYSELALSSIRKLNDCNAKNSLETLVMLTKTKV
jgi:octaprenyl-diphosphate synthase